MVTYFNKKDLVRFGEYLLSEQRTKRIKDGYSQNDNISLEERLSNVYHADLENFLESIKKVD
jgi:hypothetical protein